MNAAAVAADGPPGSFIAMSGDQLTITPTFANALNAAGPAQATEAAVGEAAGPGVAGESAEAGAADVAIQTVPLGAEQAIPAETAVASVTEALAEVTTVSVYCSFKTQVHSADNCVIGGCYRLRGHLGGYRRR